MPALTEKPVSCPYCGETITILVDDSLSEQQYQRNGSIQLAAIDACDRLRTVDFE